MRCINVKSLISLLYFYDDDDSICIVLYINLDNEQYMMLLE